MYQDVFTILVICRISAQTHPIFLGLTQGIKLLSQFLSSACLLKIAECLRYCFAEVVAGIFLFSSSWLWDFIRLSRRRGLMAEF